jgi:hypothetical protein
MSATVPKTEPAQIRAGDTWQWRREDLVDYPATVWTLSYAFKNAVKGFSFDATADGAFFAVSVVAAETGDYPAGIYRWAAQVAKGDERHTVTIGTTEVLPDVFADPDAALDTRSHARRVLDAIQATIEGRASRDQMEYSINNRTLRRTPMADLLLLRDRYRAEVQAEDAPAGTPRRHTAYLRFGNVL